MLSGSATASNERDFKKQLKELGYTLFLSLEYEPQNFIHPSNLIKKIINITYLVFYILLKGSLKELKECDNNRRHGYEHILAIHRNSLKS